MAALAITTSGACNDTVFDALATAVKNAIVANTPAADQNKVSIEKGGCKPVSILCCCIQHVLTMPDMGPALQPCWNSDHLYELSFQAEEVMIKTSCCTNAY